jgi:hypothetical protein
MTKVSEAFPSKFAKVGEDIKHGMHITIQSKMNARDGKDYNGNPAIQYDILISYDGKEGGIEEKSFQLNATNAKAIAEMYGDDDDNWIGKSMAVVLIPDTKAKSGKRALLTPPAANFQS